MPYRPRIPDDVHRRVKLAFIDDNKNLNQEYIDLIKAVYDEDGELEESFRRLTEAMEEIDGSDSMDKFDMLELVVKSVIDDEGKPKPKARNLFEVQKGSEDI